VTIRCDRAFYRTFVPGLWILLMFVAILIVGIVRDSGVQLATGIIVTSIWGSVYVGTTATYRSRVSLDASTLYLPRTFRRATPRTIPVDTIAWIGLVKIVSNNRMGYWSGWQTWLSTTDDEQVTVIPAFYPRPTKPRGGKGEEAFADTVRASAPGRFATDLWNQVHAAQGPAGILGADPYPKHLRVRWSMFWSAAPGALVQARRKKPAP
jgi:hypothetical protein